MTTHWDEYFIGAVASHFLQSSTLKRPVVVWVYPPVWHKQQLVTLEVAPCQQRSGLCGVLRPRCGPRSHSVSAALGRWVPGRESGERWVVAGWFVGRERWSFLSSFAAMFDTARYESHKLSNSEVNVWNLQGLSCQIPTDFHGFPYFQILIVLWNLVCPFDYALLACFHPKGMVPCQTKLLWLIPGQVERLFPRMCLWQNLANRCLFKDSGTEEWFVTHYESSWLSVSDFGWLLLPFYPFQKGACQSSQIFSLAEPLALSPPQAPRKKGVWPSWWVSPRRRRKGSRRPLAIGQVDLVGCWAACFGDFNVLAVNKKMKQQRDPDAPKTTDA